MLNLFVKDEVVRKYLLQFILLIDIRVTTFVVSVIWTLNIWCLPKEYGVCYGIPPTGKGDPGSATKKKIRYKTSIKSLIIVLKRFIFKHIQDIIISNWY